MALTPLQQNTATAVVFGPLVSEASGTYMSGLTINQSAVTTIPAGGTVLAEKDNASACVSAGRGYYLGYFSVNDVSALGKLVVDVAGSAALPCWHEYWVQEDDPDISTVSGVSSGLTLYTVATTADAASGRLTTADLTTYTLSALTDHPAAKVADAASARVTTSDITTYTLSALTDHPAAKVADAASGRLTSTDIVSATVSGVVLGSSGIVEATWDEKLLGNNHNIAQSSGRRLRGIQEFQGYENGAIWLSVSGVSGTTNYENGTVENPVSGMADALTINASLGFNQFHIGPGLTITLTANSDDYVFWGRDWTLALGGQSITRTHVLNANVNGTATGSDYDFTLCRINSTTTLGAGHFHDCDLNGSIVMTEAGGYHFNGCYGTDVPDIDFGSTIANTDLKMTQYMGNVEVKNLGVSGVDTVQIEGMGSLTINANCTGGTATLQGHITITDNASSAVTLSDDARWDIPQAVSAVGSGLAFYPAAKVIDAASARVTVSDITTYTLSALTDHPAAKVIDAASGRLTTAQVVSSVTSGLNLYPVASVGDVASGRLTTSDITTYTLSALTDHPAAKVIDAASARLTTSDITTYALSALTDHPAAKVADAASARLTTTDITDYASATLTAYGVGTAGDSASGRLTTVQVVSSVTSGLTLYPVASVSDAASARLTTSDITTYALSALTDHPAAKVIDAASARLTATDILTQASAALTNYSVGTDADSASGRLTTSDITTYALSALTDHPASKVIDAASGRLTSTDIVSAVSSGIIAEDVLVNSGITELTGQPGTNPGVYAAVQWEYQKSRNPIVQSATTQAVFNNAGTEIASATVSVTTGVTFTRGKFT